MSLDACETGLKTDESTSFIYADPENVLTYGLIIIIRVSSHTNIVSHHQMKQDSTVLCDRNKIVSIFQSQTDR